MTPPCGPTFVSIPVDDWDQPCAPPSLARHARTQLGDPVALAEVAEMLAAARQPVFVVGAQVALDDGWDEVITLAERHQARVWVAPMNARNSFPENHPLFMGFLGAFREQIVAALSGADLILVLGGPAFTYHAEGFGPHIPEGAQLVQLTNDPNMASWLPVGQSILTDLKAGLAALLSGPKPVQRSAEPTRTAAITLKSSPLTDAYVLQRISALRLDDSIIVEEAASSRGAMHDHLPIVRKDGFYTCASGGLGHGLSAAIGIALGSPEVRVIAILGDGAAMYAIQGLWTAARLNLPMTFIILNNRRYEALHIFGRHFGLQSLEGTDLAGLDFVALALGQGVQAVRVETAEALDAALAEAFAIEGPMLVEVVID